MSPRTVDEALVRLFQSISEPLSRYALFLVLFWFGALKVVAVSPASDLVRQLFERTIPIMPFFVFMILFGLLECLIGILFLIRGCERVVIPLLFLHMLTTFFPLVLLPQQTWSGPFIPTLEGQYIIKNTIIIALAIGIASHLHPLSAKRATS